MRPIFLFSKMELIQWIVRILEIYFFAQFPGNSILKFVLNFWMCSSFEMIFEALPSELLRFKFHSLLKNLHNPGIQPKYESYKMNHMIWSIWYGLQRPYYMGHTYGYELNGLWPSFDRYHTIFRIFFLKNPWPYLSIFIVIFDKRMDLFEFLDAKVLILRFPMCPTQV